VRQGVIFRQQKAPSVADPPERLKHRQHHEPKGLEVAHPELQWLWDSPETLVPVLERPECFSIAVVGAAAGRGAFLWGAGAPITKPVEG
jgi:hypothetical protein